MINVYLNVVGLYYGETLEVDVPGDDPSVVDVLHAAQMAGQQGKTPNSILTYELNQAPNQNSIFAIENDIRGRSPADLVSRKIRPDAVPPRKVQKELCPKVIRLEEGAYLQPSSVPGQEPSVISVAWQYYIEKARKSPPLVTTTYSIDNVIIDARVSNTSTGAKKIEDGDTVTLRLLCINTTRLPADPTLPLPIGLPSRKSVQLQTSCTETIA